MLLPHAREAIVTVCQELSRSGLVVGTAGNVSVREGDLVAVTPSGLRYAELTPELVGVHRLDGAAVEAPLGPTSELPLHLAIYAARPEVGSVVHTHSPAATALTAGAGCASARCVVGDSFSWRLSPLPWRTSSMPRARCSGLIYRPTEDR